MFAFFFFHKFRTINTRLQNGYTVYVESKQEHTNSYSYSRQTVCVGWCFHLFQNKWNCQQLTRDTTCHLKNVPVLCRGPLKPRLSLFYSLKIRRDKCRSCGFHFQLNLYKIIELFGSHWSLCSWFKEERNVWLSKLSSYLESKQI